MKANIWVRRNEMKAHRLMALLCAGILVLSPAGGQLAYAAETQEAQENAAPEIARHAPTTNAPMILGSLISNTIVVIVGFTSNCGKIGHNIVLTTSIGLIGYLPSRNEAKNKTIGKKIKSRILIISFVSLSMHITIDLIP